MSQFWILKTEPAVYGIEDLKREGRTLWEGVRNYQARNFLRSMQAGDLALIYHSNAEPPGIAGMAEVSRADLVDPSQFDPKSPYFDPKASPNKPRWWTVELEFVREFGRLIPLAELKEHFQPEELWLVRKGNRLSVLPVSPEVALAIADLALF